MGVGMWVGAEMGECQVREFKDCYSNKMESGGSGVGV